MHAVAQFSFSVSMGQALRAPCTGHGCGLPACMASPARRLLDTVLLWPDSVAASTASMLKGIRTVGGAVASDLARCHACWCCVSVLTELCRVPRCCLDNARMRCVRAAQAEAESAAVMFCHCSWLPTPRVLSCYKRVHKQPRILRANSWTASHARGTQHLAAHVPPLWPPPTPVQPSSSSPLSVQRPIYSRCCLQAKENHIPPNVQRPGGGASPAAGDAAAKLAAADKLRRQGNQMFKESRWAEAAAEYTRSVDVLQSLGRRAPAETTALLLANRAAARLMQVRGRRRLLLLAASSGPDLCSVCVGAASAGTGPGTAPGLGSSVRAHASLIIGCSYRGSLGLSRLH